MLVKKHLMAMVMVAMAAMATMVEKEEMETSQRQELMQEAIVKLEDQMAVHL